MKRIDIIAVVLLVCLGIGIAYAAGGTTLLSQGTTENSKTYYGTQRYVGSDTTSVNEFIITAIGPVHAVVKARVYAGGRWSGYAIIDSFKTTRGTVRSVTGITNDSLMRIWLPELDFVADTNKIRGRSLLKQTSKMFEWQIYVETKSADNGGGVSVTWVE